MIALVDIIETLAAAQTPVDPQAMERHEIGNVVEYLASGRPFVVADATGAEFRLRPDVAAAAVRTPDVTASTRGPDWVRFAPPSLDRYAVDRLTAWFEFAWRHAAD